MCGTQEASAPNPYNEKAFKFKLKYVDLLMERAKAKTYSTTTLTVTVQRIFFSMTGNWENYCKTSPHTNGVLAHSWLAGTLCSTGTVQARKPERVAGTLTQQKLPKRLPKPMKVQLGVKCYWGTKQMGGRL